MEKVVDKDIAIVEVQKFVEKFDDKKPKDFEVEDKYPNLLEAVELGLLVFHPETLKPSYTFKHPVKDDNQDVVLAKIEQFRTRIKPSELNDIMQGLEINKKQIEYVLRIMAFFTFQPKAMFDKMEKFDYKVLEQISSVFQ